MYKLILVYYSYSRIVVEYWYSYWYSTGTRTHTICVRVSHGVGSRVHIRKYAYVLKSNIHRIWYSSKAQSIEIETQSIKFQHTCDPILISCVLVEHEPSIWITYEEHMDTIQIVQSTRRARVQHRVQKYYSQSIRMEQSIRIGRVLV